MTATYIRGPFAKILKMSVVSLLCIGAIKDSKFIFHVQKPNPTTFVLINK